MEVKNKIILALDVLSMDQARELLDEISDYLDTIKIGYPLVLAEGLEAVTQVKEEYQCKIITDFKVADIPATNQKIADVTFQAGADALIVHGFVGSDSVASCVESAEKQGKEVFLLTEMSHPGASQFLQPVSMDIARMGVEMGIQNYVGPSTRLDRLEKIRSIIGKDSFLISPGVGTQGGDPKDTLKFADALIIGRSIYLAPDPVESLESIIDSIEF
ncbi:MAG: orotidine-5'-phosphate decarboxylase [Methanobacterium formicicum]|jgi:orotidine-5'-phosphate decarboxylase|uniref:Orotidine 5'-phosphate decarboxylase n=1 Tax=Methanobacterium formicicum TaxID=2162 RepID=A0A089ZIB7_METFO|nr:orotidine-5'-phosphate decarboxylase [Methanobacterium formicicum]AIS32348.1 orotidine 5'-phosphate decarboxylase PyrF [Methanobacterium formicicum]